MERMLPNLAVSVATALAAATRTPATAARPDPTALVEKLRVAILA